MYAPQQNREIAAFAGQRSAIAPEDGLRHQRGSGDVRLSVARSVVRGEEDDVCVPCGRSVHRVVVDVGMLEWVAVFPVSSVQEQVPVGRVTLGEVMVNHRPQGGQQQDCNCQHRQRLHSQSLQRVVQILQL